MYRGITLFSLIVLLLGMASLQPQSGFTSDGAHQDRTQQKEPSTDDPQKEGSDNPLGKDIQPNAVCQGTGRFSGNDIYDCTNESYYYRVTGGPPNSCGELHIVRNGVSEVTPCWIFTDAYGNATSRTWTVSTDQTGINIYIQWPDNSRTCGGDTKKVDDLTRPVITSIDQSGAFGAPSAFSGTASDRMYGSGFDFWTKVQGVFIDTTDGIGYWQYWDGSCYCSPTPKNINGTFSPSVGYNVSWSINPPPPSAHYSGRKYRWHVKINDVCGYGTPGVLTFTQ